MQNNKNNMQPTTILSRHFASLKRLLLSLALLACCADAAWGENYVFMWYESNSGNILKNNSGSIANTTTFNYSSCVWSGESGSNFSNNATGTTLYLYQYQQESSFSLKSSTSDWTTIMINSDYQVRRRVKGTYHARFIRFNNSNWIAEEANLLASTSTSASGTKIAYTIEPYSTSRITTPTITGSDVFTALGTSTYSASATYYYYNGYALSGPTSGLYVKDGGSVTSGNTEDSTTDGITYTWSFEDGTTDNGHAKINSSSGVVEYYKSYKVDTNVDIKVTATHTSGKSASATKKILFKDVRTEAAPASISATDMEVYVNSSSVANNYTFTTTDDDAYKAHNYVSATSADPTIASITNNNGTFTVNGLKLGTTTVTITAYGIDNTTVACTTTFKVSVTQPQTGIVGTTVILNDLEDHTWTYYAGMGDMSANPYSYPTRLYSPNPRNVRITYYGNGGEVSISENQNTFIYLLTLEQGTTSGQYPYTVISNPFSKRPSGMGFGGWKIMSGGEYISGKSNGDVLSLDEAITFVSLPYPSVNCISASIELQATWQTATIQYATSGTITFSGGTYETNLVVMKSSSSNTLTLSSPCTVMAVEPDGSADYRSNTFTGTISPDNSTMSKIEFVNWQTSSSFNAGGKNVTIGRGLTTSSTTMSELYGCNSNTADQVFKIESGKYTYFNNYSATPSSITKQYVIFGCDYDRAAGNNDNLNITGAMYISEGFGPTSSSNVEVCRVYSKSGQFVSSVSIGSAEADQSYYFGFSNSESSPGFRYLEIQGGIWHNIAGGMGTSHTETLPAVTYRIKGGTIKGSIYGAAEYAGAQGIRTFIFTGGTINGWVAGGANGTESSGGKLTGETFIYIGGKTQVDSNGSNTVINRSIGGNVFGAGCGYSSSSSSGQVNGGTNVVIADEAYVERGVYGGGSFGYCSTSETSNIYITGGHVGGVKGGVNSSGTSYESSIQGGVFGGACQNKGGSANIYMTGGLVEGGIFGGSNTSGTMSGNVVLKLDGGQIGTSSATANAHGGGYGSSTTVSGNVDITIGATNATSGVTTYGDIYGGSALGGVNSSTSNHTYVTFNKGTINGSIYGGGLGNSSNAAAVNGNVAVTINGGTLNNGAVYGCNNVNGAPSGTVNVTINGTDAKTDAKPYAIAAVYGGGNQADYSGTPVVTINNCDNSIEYVYGGGNQASVSGTDVTIYGANTIGWAFGGANSADVNGNTNMKIYGGTIEHVFGGNNHSGTISGTINLNIDGTSHNTCAMNLGEVYGGGNEASSNVGNVTLTCPGYIQELYGGARNANITGAITMNIAGGKYGTIYGGNNIGGSISGNITIGVTSGTCNTKIGTIYGGGNQADFAHATSVSVNLTASSDTVGNIYGGGNQASVGSTSVTVTNGNVSGNVFGGGKGTKGSSKVMIQSGGTNVNIYGGTLTNVFGGNDAGGTITGDLNVTVERESNSTPLKIKGDVYGGGNEADSKSGNIYISCVDSIGTVYGGARNANVTGNIVLNIKSGAIENVFGGNNLGGVVNGKIEVNVQHSGCTPIHIGSLYGAGNLADYSMPSGNSYGPVINLLPCGQATKDWNNANLHCLIVDNIFGAGKGQAGSADGKVTGNPQINVTAGEVGNIYGGGNLAAVDGNTMINISDSITGDTTYITGSVYGGGNLASTSGSATVNVKGGKISGDVYGGGAYANTGSSSTAASQKWTTVSLTGGTVNNVYGGALGDATHAPTVGGPIMVTLNGSIVNGDIFGCNNISGTPLDSVTVHIISTKARPGAGTVNTTTGEGDYHVASVYGGGNKAAYVPTQNLAACKSKVLIDGCDNVINYVYGGGNAASVPATAVTVEGGTLGWVFGGGNGAGTGNPGANVGKTVSGTAYGAGTANTLIEGGTIYHLFGGSNTKGDVVTGATLTINPPQTGGCTLKLGEVYGAGNEAEMYGYSNLILGCVKNIDVIYGGAKNANLYNDVEFTITGGTFNKVFGGNNLGGTINGSITVNIEETGCNPTVIGEVYACGNQAPYTVPAGDSLTVNINSCTSIGTVYGGGLGAAATVTGNTTVNIELVNGAFANKIDNKVGTIGTVFGGGNQAALIGDTYVNVATKSGKSARITGNVYGGGNQATVTGHTHTQIGEACE